MSSSADLAAPDAATALRIVCGPTGAGKSALAMALAERHGLTVVSADSRQIYRRFDVGTAKPAAADRARVRHLGLDVADPTERWSAARWADDATVWIAGAGLDRALVVGGTGFYLRALTTPLFDAPALDPDRRSGLAAELAVLPLDALRHRCEAVDPARAHLGRTQLLRTIEVGELTGRRLSDLHRERSRPPRYRVRWLVVDPGATLHAQIAARLDAMLVAGWVEEVRTLERTVAANAPAWQACGYREILDHVRGGRDLHATREAILIATRQYAKRQRTWFRHQLTEADVTRVDPNDPRCAELVEQWWHGIEGRSER
jgi:tRNA dimethylallyltransferase